MKGIQNKLRRHGRLHQRKSLDLEIDAPYASFSAWNLARKSSKSEAPQTQTLREETEHSNFWNLLSLVFQHRDDD